MSKDLENPNATDEMSIVRGSNQSGMRAHNERLVLTLIRQKGPLAKAEIARLTGLSAQTVSVIMRSLEAEGFLKKGEPVRGKVGQPSVPMGLAPNGAFFIGLKIGRRSLDLILVDFIGHIRARSTQTYRLPTPDGVVKFVEHALGQILDQLSSEERKRVAGLGIAMPFRMWDWGAALDVDPAEMSDWKHRDIEQEIAEICDFPVYLQNDGSAACGAELVFGAQDRPQNFLYFFFGFFIGGGVVLNNTLFTGESGNAGALASLPLAQRDGKIQQLVDVASLATLETALIQAGIDPNRIWHSAHDWNIPETIIETWVNNCVEAMSFGIVSAASLIDFDCIVLDGWLPRAICQRLITGINATLSGFSVAGIDLPEVRMGTIGNDARALGAASLALSNRYMVDQTAFMRTTK